MWVAERQRGWCIYCEQVGDIEDKKKKTDANKQGWNTFLKGVDLIMWA